MERGMTVVIGVVLMAIALLIMFIGIEIEKTNENAKELKVNNDYLNKHIKQLEEINLQQEMELGVMEMDTLSIASRNPFIKEYTLTKIPHKKIYMTNDLNAKFIKIIRRQRKSELKVGTMNSEYDLEFTLNDLYLCMVLEELRLLGVNRVCRTNFLKTFIEQNYFKEFNIFNPAFMRIRFSDSNHLENVRVGDYFFNIDGAIILNTARIYQMLSYNLKS